MGQVFHGSATTTEASGAIRHSQERPENPRQALRHQPEDRRKMKRRASVADLLTRPKEPKVCVTKLVGKGPCRRARMLKISAFQMRQETGVVRTWTSG